MNPTTKKTNEPNKQWSKSSTTNDQHKTPFYNNSSLPVNEPNALQPMNNEPSNKISKEPNNITTTNNQHKTTCHN